VVIISSCFYGWLFSATALRSLSPIPVFPNPVKHLSRQEKEFAFLLKIGYPVFIVPFNTAAYP